MTQTYIADVLSAMFHRFVLAFGSSFFSTPILCKMEIVPKDTLRALRTKHARQFHKSVNLKFSSECDYFLASFWHGSNIALAIQGFECVFRFNVDLDVCVFAVYTVQYALCTFLAKFKMNLGNAQEIRVKNAWNVNTLWLSNVNGLFESVLHVLLSSKACDCENLSNIFRHIKLCTTWKDDGLSYFVVKSRMTLTKLCNVHITWCWINLKCINCTITITMKFEMSLLLSIPSFVYSTRTLNPMPIGQGNRIGNQWISKYKWGRHQRIVYLFRIIALVLF